MIAPGGPRHKAARRAGQSIGAAGNGCADFFGEGATPILELRSDVLTNPHRIQLDYLSAVMLWPAADDESARQAYREAAGKQFMIAELKAGAPPLAAGVADAMEWASEPPTFHSLKDEIGRRYKWGTIVGQYVYEMIGRPGEKAAIVKNAVTSRLGEFKESMFNNEILPTMKPAAHLWAARCIQYGETRRTYMPCIPSDLASFLAEAEWFLAQGAALIPRQSRVALLDTATAWRVPPAIVLPRAILQRRVLN
jgi:hypothetical protein